MEVFLNILLIIIFYVALILAFYYVVCIVEFSDVSRKVFYKNVALLSLNTDWKNTFLEYLSEKIRFLFHAPFISITRLKTINTGRVIISSGNKKIGFLMDCIEKDEYYLHKRQKPFLPYVYQTEDVLIKKDQKNQNILNSYHLGHSFMIPVYFSDQKVEVFISLYFRSFFMKLLAYVKYLMIRQRFSYFFAGIFRNFVISLENSAELLLEEIEDYVVISLNEKEEIVAWNKGAEKLFSYKSTEIIEHNFRDLFSEGEEDSFGKSLEILNIKNNIKYFTTLKDKLNIPIRVELKIKKMMTVTGELAGYSVFVKDITKEEIFKENIEQHSFINYTILENSHDGILILDSEDKVIFYNQRIRTILGNSMNLFGIPGRKIFPRHFGEEFDQNIQTIKSTKLEFIDIDYSFENKHYNVRFFRVHKNSKNEYGGVIVFFIDESVRMSTMMELEDKKEALERINTNLMDALSSARIMQETLVPKQLPKQDGVSVEAVYELSDDLGGDFYYSKNLIVNNKKYNITFISDVSGHGISSSMMNVMVKDVYGTYIDLIKSGTPVEPFCFLELLNKKILDLSVEDNKFITCVAMIVDLEEKIAKICSAGHTLPYYIQEDNVSLLNFKRAVPLGVIDLIQCDTEEIHYKKGDRLILYTDGFLDLFEIDDQKPSDSALHFLEETKDLSIKEIKNITQEKHLAYKQEHLSQTDDLTILFVEFDD